MAYELLTRDKYTVWVVCALPVEQIALEAVLDERHAKLGIDAADDNDYVLGRIGIHNVVIACLPAGLMGIGRAASVIKDMARSFENLKFGLMVGVGGGVWSPENDLRLGDVVAGVPEGENPGVVQWDFGKTEKGGKFKRTQSLNKPPMILLHAVQTLRTREWTKAGNGIRTRLEEVYTKNSTGLSDAFQFQGEEHDRLFEATYDHGDSDLPCSHCDSKRIVQRLPTRKDPPSPRVYYGTVASGNQVIKHGITRDRIAKEHNAICFEMEAAGLDGFPFLVIRGICDYADSHKNKRWQPYASLTAAAYMKELLSVVKEQTPTVKNSPKHFMAPRKNPNFVARQGVEREIERVIKRQSVGSQVRIALCGLGGIGKSQIALNFAHKSKTNYNVFWVQAATSEQFHSDYSMIGRMVGVVNENSRAEDSCLAVKQWLDSEKSGNWRLIIDNLDDDTSDPVRDLVSDSLPLYRGTILFTTRNENIIGNTIDEGFGIRLSEMTDSEAKFTFQKLGDISDEDVKSEATTRLLELFGNIPLAIAQAAAYIRKQRVKVSRYLDLLQSSESSQVTLLQKPIANKIGHTHDQTGGSVMSTWGLSFNYIQSKNPSAAALLQVMSLLDFQKIPREILSAQALTALGISGSEALDDAIEILLSFSLIAVRQEEDDDNDIGNSPQYQMHRLVSLWTRTLALSQEEIILATLLSMQEVFPEEVLDENFLKWSHLSTHVTNVLAYSQDLSERDDSRMALTLKLASYFLSAGYYDMAETKLQECWEFYQSQPEKYPMEYLYCVRQFGHTALERGKFDDALYWYQKAVDKIQKRQQQDDEHNYYLHEIALQEIEVNMGKAYFSLQRLDTAMEYFQRVISRKQIQGEVPNEAMAKARSNAGAVLTQQGKIAEAFQYFYKAWKDQKELLGENHATTLVAQGILGAAHKRLGEYDQAISHFEEAVAGLKKALGKNHPQTLQACGNMAVCLSAMGCYDRALQVHQQVLQGQQERLGNAHATTLNTLHSIGETYKRQGNYKLALETYLEVLAGREVSEGPSNHSLWYYVTVDSMGDAYTGLGDYEKAIESYDNSWNGARNILFDGHPMVLEMLERKADTLVLKGNTESAFRCMNEVFKGKLNSLGPENPSTIKTEEKIALLMAQL